MQSWLPLLTRSGPSGGGSRSLGAAAHAIGPDANEPRVVESGSTSAAATIPEIVPTETVPARCATPELPATDRRPGGARAQDAHQAVQPFAPSLAARDGIVRSVSLASSAPAPIRSLLGPVVEHLLYQDRLYDEDGEPLELGPVRRMIVRLNQGLIERGRTPPWVWSRDECEQFWRASGAGTEGNRPEDYATKHKAIVDFLDHFWRPEVGPDASILEIGCNAGSNLDRLRELGYRRLGGVEINEAALRQLRSTYPELAQSAALHLGPAENVVRELPDNSVDVVFTMAVLLHIHPSNAALFGDLVRVARKYVCTIEAESALASYVFPRNYERVFGHLNASQLRSIRLARSLHPDVGFGYFGYTARLMLVGG